MNVRVRVLDTTHVRPELPGHAATIKLSPFDTLFLALPPIQRIFFYDDDGAPSLPPFPAIVRSLLASLAATLSVFAPLAGRLAASLDGDLVVDCSLDALQLGVKFVQAEYSGDAADMRRLARDAEHDTEAFVQLVPELEVARLPAPLLAVQVTRPVLSGGDDQGAGAVVVRISMHHEVADGQSLFQFMRAWAAASREGSPAVAGLVPPPTFDRSVIMRHPKAEAAARNFARLCAPDLPIVNTMPELDWTRQSRRTYLLDAGQIQSLKRRIVQQRQAAGADNDNQPPPSTYVAVASLLWTSMARAKHPDQAVNAGAADDAYLLFPADCRRRMQPPLDPGFFGNCVKLCFARATASKLVCRDDDDGALAHAAGALRRAIREQVEEKDPLGDADRWAETYQGIPPERRSQQGSSHRFMAYEVDFGWGQPSRAEIVSMFSPEVAMLVGAVQVSVALGRDLIDGFEACFMSLVSP
ncbi:hypothetical protein CFC21_054752 [Triticum aestivum]|uniref:Anthocyanin 5-aromatic acyltransferase n=2 Tax=Triticum aestivum TaxID=4565 RepID=A0A3B6I0V2_WHEAT|nr:anthocyanin 5-aromatic acyltransferase-like [Triticum aestivum]KAF7045669.1 hypothetical protein CFC21_054752 [Triticum aestivum]